MRTRRSPGAKSRATSTPPSATAKDTAYQAEDGYQAPDAEDRAVKQAIAVLSEYGYGIAMRCLDCHRPITSAASLQRMRGRVCQARAEAVTDA